MARAAAMEQIAAIEAANERLAALAEACDVWGAALEFIHEALRVSAREARAIYSGLEFPKSGGLSWSVKEPPK